MVLTQQKKPAAKQSTQKKHASADDELARLRKENEKLRSKLSKSRRPVPQARILRKPPGQAGRTTAGGFSTRLAAGIEDNDAWNFFVRYIRAITASRLDPTVSFKHQNPSVVKAVRQQVQEKIPFFAHFERGWIIDAVIKSWVTPASIAIKKGIKKHAHKCSDGPNEEAYEYIDLLYSYKEASEATKRAQGDCNESGHEESTDESNTEEGSDEEPAEDEANTSAPKQMKSHEAQATKQRVESSSTAKPSTTKTNAARPSKGNTAKASAPIAAKPITVKSSTTKPRAEGSIASIASAKKPSPPKASATKTNATKASADKSNPSSTSTKKKRLSRIATRAALLEGLRDKVYKHSHEDSGDDQPQKAARATSATSKKVHQEKQNSASSHRRRRVVLSDTEDQPKVNEAVDDTQEELDALDEAAEDGTQEQDSHQPNDVENNQEAQHQEDDIMNDSDQGNDWVTPMEVDDNDNAIGSEGEEQSAGAQSDNQEDVKQQYDYSCPIPDCLQRIPVTEYTTARVEEIRNARWAEDWAKYDETSLELHCYHEQLEHEQAIHALGEAHRWPLLINIDEFPARVAKFASDVLPMITHLSSLIHSRVWRDYIEAIQDDPEVFTTKNFRTTEPHAGYHGPFGFKTLASLVYGFIAPLALEDQWNETVRRYGRSALASKEGSALFWQEAIKQPWFSLKEFCITVATPHVTNLMIAEDFELSYSSAHRARMISKEYGDLLFPLEKNTRWMVRNLLTSSVCTGLIEQFVIKHQAAPRQLPQSDPGHSVARATPRNRHPHSDPTHIQDDSAISQQTNFRPAPPSSQATRNPTLLNPPRAPTTTAAKSTTTNRPPLSQSTAPTTKPTKTNEPPAPLSQVTVVPMMKPNHTLPPPPSQAKVLHAMDPPPPSQAKLTVKLPARTGNPPLSKSTAVNVRKQKIKDKNMAIPSQPTQSQPVRRSSRQQSKAYVPMTEVDSMSE